MCDQSCSTPNCPRLSRVLCFCCQTKFCIEHLNTHNDLYLSQLHELTNELNLLTECYRDRYRQQLNQWRHESHKTIDFYYEKKCQELDNKINSNANLNKNRQVIEWIQLKIMKSIREQNTSQQQIDSLKAVINVLRREYDEIPQEIFELTLPSLVFEENFNLQYSYLTKDFSNMNCIVMANSQDYLLIGQESSLCLLDSKLDQVKQISWTHDCIWDMCRSNYLSKFILVAENGIFTLDEQTMSIELREDLIKDETVWYCCIATDKRLFLSSQQLNTGLSEYVYCKKKFSLKQQINCCSSNEYIECMKCSNDYLALVILNDLTDERHFKMHSNKTLDQIWTMKLNIQEKINIISCSSLNEKGWLLTDFVQSRFIHINNQGDIKQTIPYSSAPVYALQLYDKTLAILTEKKIYLHRIQ